MITAQEASRALFGAWRLARFDANGITFFDNTVEAFWRSFWAAAIALPAYAVLLILGNAGTTIGAGPIYTFLVYSIAYVIDWLAFPFVMLYVAHLFDRSQWYCRYFAAYNWAIVLQMLLQLIISILAASDILPPAAEALIKVAAFFFILAYQGFIAHVALQATLSGAVGCVVLSFLLSFMLIEWSDRLLQLQRVVTG
jgi:hypothetical protein